MAPELRQLACLSGVRLGANSQDMRVLRHFAGEASAIRAAGSPVTLAGWMTSLIAASELGSAAEIRSTLDSLPLALLGSASVADQCHVERVACLAERIVGNLNGAAERGQRGFQLAMEYGLAHQARVAADSLAFLFMDYCRLEEAEHWIRIGSGLAGASKFGITLRSTDHAFDRLLLQQGRCEELLRRVESRPPNLHAAVRSPNRLGELSLAAYAFSANGDVTRATAYAQRVIGSLHDELGQLAHHFPVELASRALRNVGQPDEADALSRKHRDSYFSMGRPPLPPFFVEISQGSA